MHGIPRQTNDLDLVADLGLAEVDVMVHRLQDRFYIDSEMIRRAIHRRGSFNLVHLGTGFKIDIFLLGSRPFDRAEFSRHGLHRIESFPRDLMVKSAEDTILRKLEWYRIGGEVSDRQWNDILGILRTQKTDLDLTYLRRWAVELDVEDLLETSLQTA